MEPLVTVTSSFLRPAPELGGELNVSERTGWAQLYLVTPDDPSGGTPLTRGDWEVISVDHVDGETRRILATGVGREADRNPSSRSPYRAHVDSPAPGAQPLLLPPAPLHHHVPLPPSGKCSLSAPPPPPPP